MKTRIITAAVGLVILGIIMMLFNTPVLELALSLVTLIGIHEIFKAFDLGEKTTHIYAAFVPYVLLMMFSSYGFAGGLQLKVLMIPATYLLVLYLAICLIRRSQTLSAAKLGGMTMFSAITILGFYSMEYIRSVLPSQEAIYLILTGLAFAWGGDTFAYFAGRFFGKHKLAPIVSPKKTVEGAIGGIFGSGILGIGIMAAARALTDGAVGGTFSYPVIFILGMACSVLGIFGDLFASAVKRQCGIKDYGTIFPGHGGILDRFDSVLFIMPLVAMAVWFMVSVLPQMNTMMVAGVMVTG